MLRPKHISLLSLIPLALLVISCKDGKTDGKDSIEHPVDVSQTTADDQISNSSVKIDTSDNSTDIQKLKEAYRSKNEALFLEQFPSDFYQLLEYFGWYDDSDRPNELYEESNDYINYFFELISKEKYRKFESKLLAICVNGRWETDGINYFQDLTLDYIKNGERYDLIDDLTSDEAKSVLFFLFDGPYPKLDTEFASHLSPSKKRILEELFEIGFYDDNENPDPIILDEEGNTVPYSFSNYLGSEHFFIRDIDVNKDGLLDKIVSAGPYQGDELLLFIHKDDEFQFALKSTNFSEDGGNQIVDIVAEKGGFYIKTAFPDRGLSEAYHHITYKNHAWILVNTVYKTQSNQEDAFIYSCDVKQGINLADTNIGEQLKWMPDEADRNRLCTKTKS